jgi:hypothetical protein
MTSLLALKHEGLSQQNRSTLSANEPKRVIPELPLHFVHRGLDFPRLPFAAEKNPLMF